MDARISELIDKINALEDEVNSTIAARRAELGYEIERRKIRFRQGVKRQQKKAKVSLYRFLRNAKLRHVASAPFIYMMIVPFALMDALLFIYQNSFFRLCGIPLVTRGDYVVIDRHQLAYLNIIEKLNCVYCGYVNGLIAFVREIGARTEQYWCPIKHGLPAKGLHHLTANFADFGDAEAYRKELEELREKLRKLDTDAPGKKTSGKGRD